MAHGKLASVDDLDVDDLYFARASIQQPAVACCLRMAHGELACADDLYIALAAILLPAVVDCWGT